MGRIRPRLVLAHKVGVARLAHSLGARAIASHHASHAPSHPTCEPCAAGGAGWLSLGPSPRWSARRFHACLGATHRLSRTRGPFTMSKTVRAAHAGLVGAGRWRSCCALAGVSSLPVVRALPAPPSRDPQFVGAQRAFEGKSAGARSALRRTPSLMPSAGLQGLGHKNPPNRLRHPAAGKNKS
jgi:hypothetical protein